MKTFILTAFIFISGFTATAQTFGASGLEVAGTFETTRPVYRQWLKLGDRPDVTMKFELTPQGLRDAIQLTQEILIKNELNIGRPDIYKSIEADVQTSDTESLHKAIQEGTARVNQAWYSPGGATLHLFLGKYSYEVNVLKAYKLE